MYEGQGLRTFLDTKACAKSPVARFIQQYPTSSQNVIGHIRCATHGKVGLENCHPFVREMWGIPWCFAHNGDVPLLSNQRAGHHVCLGKTTNDAKNLFHHTMGDTDSEMVFCAILNALRVEFHDALPTLPDLFEALQRLLNELVSRDDTLINNFLLGCGPNILFCYSWPGQRPGSNVWNGLYYLVREPPMECTVHLKDLDYSLDLNLTKKSDRMVVVTTKPLTDEKGWVEMKHGELLMVEQGTIFRTASAIRAVEEEGRGLSSRCFVKIAVNEEEKGVLER